MVPLVDDFFRLHPAARLPIDPSPSSHENNPAGSSDAAGHPPPVDPPAGSLTQLDPEETSEGLIPTDDVERPDDISRRLAERFVHTFWHDRRRRTAECLEMLYPKSRRIEAFCACASNAYVMRSSNEPVRYAIRSAKCHDRWCEYCQGARRRMVASNLQDSLLERFNLPSPKSKTERLRFITLTMKSRKTPIKEQITALYSYLRRFRASSKIKAAMTGGISFLEITYNQDRGEYHPHLHILYEGSYLDKNLISQTWHKITGDSYITDIRRIYSISGAIAYVVKYSGKVVNGSIYNNRNVFCEVIQALSGRRTFNVFGDWKGFELSKNRDTDTVWVPLCSLAILIKRERAGDVSARKILSNLRSTNHEQIDDVDSKPP